MYLNISRIHLENFQSIKNPITLKFAPITLLYGQNSVGKSAIFDAIGIINKLCNDPFSGSLLNNTYMHDSDATMVIGAGFKLKNPANYWNAHFKLDLDSIFPSLMEYIEGTSDDSPWVDFDIIFRVKGGWVRSFEINIDNQVFMIHDTHEHTLEINLACTYMVEIDKKIKSDISETFLDLCNSVMHNLKNKDNKMIIESIYTDQEYHEGCMFDFLNHPFYKSEVTSQERQHVELLLSFLLTTPLSAYSNIVRHSSVRIGPLRKIPEREDLYFYMREKQHLSKYECASSVTDWKMSWFDGSSAWKELAEDKEVTILRSEDSQINIEKVGVLPSVNDWLSSHNKLDMPYRLDRSLIRIKHEDVSESSRDPIAHAPSGIYHEAIAEIRLNAQAYEGGDLTLNLCDVGSGVSQVIPILVAGFVKNLLFLEQPELHLHPKLQTDLADFFISRWNQDYLRTVIETHSEYMALRLLRRIREAKASDIMPDSLRLDKTDIVFYYFDSVEGSTHITELRVSDEGEFMDRWPKGFFSERERELFDEDY